MHPNRTPARSQSKVSSDPIETSSERRSGAKSAGRATVPHPAVEAMPFDEAELRRGWEILTRPGEYHEVCFLPFTTTRVCPGGTEGVPAVIAAVRELGNGSKSAHLSLNPVDAGLNGRARDIHVARRRWLFVDFDPIRPTDTNATDGEHEAARLACLAAVGKLAALGWPEPVVGPSGNGWHAYYAVDLPNDKPARELLKTTLERLASEFKAEGVGIDTSVHNAARLTKLFGTVSRKAPHTKERPHRPSALVGVPDRIEVLTESQLREFVAPPAKMPPTPRRETLPPLTDAAARAGTAPERYARSALDRETALVAGTPPGNRNPQLNRSAFAMGQLIGGGVIDRAEVETALAAAARSAGLGDFEITATLASGIEAGIANPRDLSHVGTKGTPKRPDLRVVAAEGPGDVEGVEDDRPEIVITVEEHEVIRQGVAALAEREDNIFQRGLALTAVHQIAGDPHDPIDDDRVKVGRFRRPIGAPKIVPLAAPTVRELLTKTARWRKRKPLKGGDFQLVPAHPPEWAPAMIHARKNWPGIRPLDGVSETPILRPDGTIFDDPRHDGGYDRETAVLYRPAVRFPKMPARPTKVDAEAAASRLFDLVADFPFKSEEHKAAWLALLLTLVGRHAVEGPVPLFLVTANTSAAGKSKLIDLAAVAATGRVSPRTACPARDKDEEMAKIIGASVLAGDRLMMLDNVESGSEFGFPSLDAAITAEELKPRILGKSELAEMPHHVTWIATGNNVSTRNDMLRRVVFVRLESLEERPEEREDFKLKRDCACGCMGDIVKHAKGRWPSLFVDAVTILRAHALAGRPATGLKPVDFPAWCRSVRDAIHWASGFDPCATRTELADDDAELTKTRALILGWAELPDSAEGLSCRKALELVEPKPAKTADGSFVLATENNYPLFREALAALGVRAEATQAAKLGKRLDKYNGKVIDSKVLRKRFNTDAKTNRWSVEDIKVTGGTGGYGGSPPTPRGKNSSPGQAISVGGSLSNFPPNDRKHPPSPPVPPVSPPLQFTEDFDL